MGLGPAQLIVELAGGDPGDLAGGPGDVDWPGGPGGSGDPMAAPAVLTQVAPAALAGLTVPAGLTARTGLAAWRSRRGCRCRCCPGFREMALRRMAAERRQLVKELAERRKSAGLSQTEVAARMGTSQSAVARLEGGDADVRASTLERYAAAIGSQITWRHRTGFDRGRQKENPEDDHIPRWLVPAPAADAALAARAAGAARPAPAASPPQLRRSSPTGYGSSRASGRAGCTSGC